MSDRVFYCEQLFGDSIQQFPPHYVKWAETNYGVSTADKLRKASYPMDLMTGGEIREMLGDESLLPRWEVTNLKSDVQKVVDRYYASKGKGKDGKGDDGKGKDGKGKDGKPELNGMGAALGAARRHA